MRIALSLIALTIIILVIAGIWKYRKIIEKKVQNEIDVLRADLMGDKEKAIKLADEVEKKIISTATRIGDDIK